MLEPSDYTLYTEFELAIRKILVGDDNTDGYYTTIRRSTDWENFVEMRGMIRGYEGALDQLRAIVRRMNEPHARRDEARVAN